MIPVCMCSDMLGPKIINPGCPVHGEQTSEEQLSTKTFKEITEINLPCIGLGTLRTSGTYIAVLLQLEDKGQRANILIDVAKQLGLTLEEITDTYLDYGCPKCGISMKLHKAQDGRCF